MIRQDGFYFSFVLLIEGEHIVVLNKGYLIAVFLHIEKAEATEP